jgi:hypothetical protein
VASSAAHKNFDPTPARAVGSAESQKIPGGSDLLNVLK